MDFLLSRFPDSSGDGLRRLLAAGGCQVDGVARTGGWRLKPGQMVRMAANLYLPELVAEDLALSVLYQDEQLIAIDKPAGMLSHPTGRERRGTVVNGLRFLLHGGRPHILHRLDRLTSGVLLAARELERGAPAARLFETRQVQKVYAARVQGRPDWEEITVNTPIGRVAGEQPQWRALPDGGQAAETLFRVVERGARSTLLEARPVTGRTNQIRIHAAVLGFPIVGDIAYGAAPADRMMLHARQLTLPDARAHQIVINSELPSEFLANY